MANRETEDPLGEKPLFEDIFPQEELIHAVYARIKKQQAEAANTKARGRAFRAQQQRERKFIDQQMKSRMGLDWGRRNY